MGALFESSEFVNFTSLKHKNLFAINSAPLLDKNLLRHNRSDSTLYLEHCVEGFESFFFRKNILPYFCLLFQMDNERVFSKFKRIESFVQDDHLFLFTYPSMMNNTSPELCSFLITSHLFNLYFSDTSGKLENPLIEQFYTQFKSKMESFWSIRLEIHACIVDPFIKLCLIFENLPRTNSFTISLFLSMVLSLITNRKPLGFKLLNHVFKKYKKSCIFISKIFICEILKALNDENEELPKEIVCECFCLVLTLAYIDEKNLEEKDFCMKAINECPELLAIYGKGKSFLFDFKNYKNFEIFIPSNLTLNKIILRQYQLEGIKWLNFLWKYELNGILCDDMGLGKTIQSLITISLQILEEFKKVVNEDNQKLIEILENLKLEKNLNYLKIIKSNLAIVVCPNNLVYHWQHECKARINSCVLDPVIVDSSVLAHNSLSQFIKTSNYQNLNRCYFILKLLLEGKIGFQIT